MKIVHLIEYFSPALGYQETYLVKEQLRLGHDVVVVTSDRYFPFPNYDQTVRSVLGERIIGPMQRTEEGIPVIRKSILFECFTRAWIGDLIPTLKQLKPDAIHIHGSFALSTIRIALARRLFSRTVILVDDHSHLSVVAGHIEKTVFYALFRVLFGRLISTQIDHIVAITSETKKIVRTTMGITSPIHIIELGADTEMFSPQPKKRSMVRRKLGFTPNDVVFIYTGKIISDKGPDVLVDAFVSIPGHRAKLLLVGGGESTYIAQLKAILAKANKTADVVWVAMVTPKELPAYYAASDVGVWPKQESISMIEAAACELPVIVKESPSMAVRVKNHNGLMYPEGNVQKLKQLMQKLVENSALRRSMGENGRVLVVEQYSWKSIARQFISLYTKRTK